MAFILFKYYSQFQHISPISNKLLRNNPQIIDYKYLIHSIENLFIATNLGLKMGTPKHDGSGKGRRANQGRGGCKTTRKTGKGR